MANEWMVSRRFAVYPVYSWELGSSSATITSFVEPTVILATPETARVEGASVPTFRLVPAGSLGANYFEVPDQPNIDSVMAEVKSRLANLPPDVEGSPNPARFQK
jgi:hypothetical protein